MKKIIFLFFILMGCGNIFKQMSRSTTDEALLFSAKMHMDEGSWALAIADFDSMSASFKTDREVKALHASAYAGKCGLRFLQFVDAFSTNTSPILAFLFAQFPASTATLQSDCIQAETLLKQIGNESVRNGDENFLMAFVSLAKVGVILNKSADTDVNNTVDNTFNPCTTIVDADANELVTGIAIAITSLTAVGASMGGITSSFSTVCGQLGGGTNFCSVTDHTTVAPADMINYRNGVRSMVKEGASMGLGNLTNPTCTGNPATCFCP